VDGARHHSWPDARGGAFYIAAATEVLTL
jgi:hypothetical protein